MFRSLARVAAFLLLLLLLAGASERTKPVAAQQSYPTGASKIESANAETAAGDWPMYGHDQAHTNYNPAETLISAANVDQLTRLWRYRIGNSGTPSNSSPTVVNGKVYVGSSAASGDNFFALDAVTGAWVWSTDLHFSGGCIPVGIPSTASISGNTLVVGGGDSAYYGLNADTGTTLWREPLNVGPSGYAWESPFIVGDRVYLGVSAQCDNPSVRGEIRVLDLHSGSRLNQIYFVPEGQRGAGIWNTPALSADGSKLIVTTGEENDGFETPYTRAFLSMDPNTMQVFGAHRTGSSGVDHDWATSPVIFHDKDGRELSGAVHKDGHFYVYRVDDIGAGPIWERQTGVSLGMMPGYDPTYGDGGTVFVASSNRIWAFDPATGEERWPARTISTPNAHMAIANGLIFLNTNGALTILDETNGQILRVITPRNAGCAYSGPVVANGIVYWHSGAYINAWGLPPANSTPTRTPAPTVAPIETAIPAVTATPCANSFGDVASSDYYFDAVRYLSCNSVISGYTDGTFRPFNETTRGQLAKIVVLAFGFPIIVPPEESFTDVAFDSPFFLYIETIASRGIVSGYCDGSFRPWASITRGQISKIMVAAAGWELATPSTPTFGDVSSTNTFYAEIETAYAHGLISGYSDGTFRWGSRATRGQISKIIYQALNSNTKQ